jgi:hypothetical protein
MVDDAYIISNVYDLPPDTDVGKLRQAFEEFINHPNGSMIRTVFVFESSSNWFLQVLTWPGARRMDWTSISVVDEAELEAAIANYTCSHGSRSFADGELLTRACVFVLNRFARALVWTVHHVVQDGWTQHGHLSDI